MKTYLHIFLSFWKSFETNSICSSYYIYPRAVAARLQRSNHREHFSCMTSRAKYNKGFYCLAANYKRLMTFAVDSVQDVPCTQHQCDATHYQNRKQHDKDAIIWNKFSVNIASTFSAAEYYMNSYRMSCSSSGFSRNDCILSFPKIFVPAISIHSFTLEHSLMYGSASLSPLTIWVVYLYLTHLFHSFKINTLWCTFFPHSFHKNTIFKQVHLIFTHCTTYLSQKTKSNALIGLQVFISHFYASLG